MENSSEIPNPVKLAVQAIVKNLSFFIKRTFRNATRTGMIRIGTIQQNKNRYQVFNAALVVYGQWNPCKASYFRLIRN